jgi:hypothetical protein
MSSAAIASSAAWSNWRRSPRLASIGGAGRCCSRWCRAARAPRVAEIDLDTRVDGELEVLGYLPAWSQVSERRSCWGGPSTAVVSSGRMRSAVHPLGRGNSSTSRL